MKIGNEVFNNNFVVRVYMEKVREDELYYVCVVLENGSSSKIPFESEEECIEAINDVADDFEKESDFYNHAVNV
jgi:hypothetical protein